MAESAYHFSVKTIGLSRCNGRKPCTLLEAARHNLREIQAERGAVAGRIDVQRMGENRLLAGPGTASEVEAQSRSLLARVDTTRLKRDHVQAVEVVFSLPPGTAIESGNYFLNCLKWLRGALPMPVLLATVHNDEAAPHMHVLMLPIHSGKHIGGAMIGREKLLRLRDAFFTNVAGPAGLQRHGAKLRGQPKRWAADAVLRTCDAQGIPTALGKMWPLFRAFIERDPTPHVLALGIEMATIRESMLAAPPSPIALDSSPIALPQSEQEAQGLSCVALESKAFVTNPPKTIETLEELWAIVGCHTTCAAHRKAARILKARAAQQFAIARHSPTRSKCPESAPSAGDEGWVRVRDEQVDDLSAWT